MYVHFFKPLLDKIATLLGLLLLGWLLVIVAVIVWLRMGKPVFFLQKRTAQHGRIFVLYKFRTMLPDGQSITALGHFLRRTNLDELPQLLNVLKGDISLVGPRPLLPEYTAHYTPKQAQRLRVAQGLTGLAQLKGYTQPLTWAQKLEYDAQYANTQTFLLDLRILVLTAWAVFFKKRLNHSDLSRFDAQNPQP
ncbi:sugar transferase EpsL [Flexibacter flexilis DSM 6793]|uniref:Sugar transferase EpsL n=1 Tax=Flexibacter flexilis DSM 6793 TaxID=927664 RepID=A0A1I1D932_9BACT|nr:sugar transferase [Flexibacter flexilis]SFB71529.1 sugar transferase EpsL [Flexibacter flexilis DSM 6793]